MSSVVDSTQRGKQIFWVTVGVIISSIGQYYFLLPDNILAGGASGLSMVLNEFIPLPYSVILFVLNALLLILGYLFVGRNFGGLTLYATLLGSALIGVFDFLLPMHAPITSDIMLNMVFGTLLMAVGIGWVFNANASTGGTDILAVMIKKYLGYSLSQGVMVVESVIIAATFGTFGMRKGLYALLSILLFIICMNKVVAGGEGRFEITIMTSKTEAINRYIIEEINRSTTLYHAEGGYQRKPRLVLMSIVDGRQLIKIKQFVHKIDPNAFFYVNSITDISGLGFTFNYHPMSTIDEEEKDVLEMEEAKKLEKAEHVKPYGVYRERMKQQSAEKKAQMKQTATEATKTPSDVSSHNEDPNP
ncbi:MAG: YitT family protein [Aerococcus sp.]|nr:YitT family protein [Aerococcus sp.]